MHKVSVKNDIVFETNELTHVLNLELSDIFYTNQKKGRIFRVILNVNGFTLQRETGTKVKEELIKICDIIGARCFRMQRSNRLGNICACSSSSSNNLHIPFQKPSTEVNNRNVSAYLSIFAYILKKNLRNVLRRERTVLTLRFRTFDTYDENISEAERWYKTLKSLKYQTVNTIYHMPSEHRNQRLLILLNPKSGIRKARDLFQQEVIPVLNEAELLFDLFITKHANFACEFVRQRDLNSWSGIVAVGGDGLFFEILNGIFQRTDSNEILENISLGIVPCGSGNGLARSIAHIYKEPYYPKPILGAALSIVSGQTTLMDVVRVEVSNQILYSVLSVGWGLISDIDIESERLRLLGYQRFALWSLHRLINLRKYPGKISYIVKSDIICETFSLYEKKSTLKHSNSCNIFKTKNVIKCFNSTEYINSNSDYQDIISLETLANMSSRARCNSWFSANSQKSTYYSINDSVYQSLTEGSNLTMNLEVNNVDIHKPSDSNSPAPSLNDSITDTWIEEEGEFVMVHAVCQSHLSIDCFFAPSAKLNDGIIYLVIIRYGISRSQLLNFLINMSSGTHLPTNNNEYVKVIAVTAFRIEPYNTEGIITVDGERIEFGPVQGKILPGIMKVMVPTSTVR